MNLREIERACAEGAKCIARKQFEKGLQTFESALPHTSAADERGPLLYNIAICHSRLGNIDKAIESLEEAVSIHDEARMEFLINNDFPELKSDARYEALKGKCKGSGGVALNSFRVFVGNESADLSESITRLGPNSVFSASALRDACITIDPAGIAFAIQHDDGEQKRLASYPLDSIARIEICKNAGPKVGHQLIRPGLTSLLTGAVISAGIFFFQKGVLNQGQRILGFIVATVIIGGIFMLFNLAGIKWKPLHRLLIIQRTTNSGIAAWIDGHQLKRLTQELEKYKLTIQEGSQAGGM